MLACDLQMLFNSLLGAKRALTRVRIDFRTVMHNALERYRVFRAQDSQHLCEQLVQRCPMLDPEVRQRVMIHYAQTGQPLKCWLILATTGDLSRRADTAAVCI